MHKTLSKLMLDIVLTALFVVLIYPRETGFSFHEVAGLASGALVIVHLLLNWSWVKNVSKNLLSPKLKTKTKLFYLLNTVSAGMLLGIIITGILISKVVFPGVGSASASIVLWHKWLSYSCLGLFGLHLALHWNFFTQTVPRLFKSKALPAPGKLALNLCALVLTLGLVFSPLAPPLTADVVQPTTNQQTSSSNEAIVETRPQPTVDSLSASSTGSSPPAPGNKRSRAVATTTTSVISSSSNTTSSSTSISSATSSSSTMAPITLTQYLGNLFCTGCSKHCSLLSPQCSIGVTQAATARQEYTAIYGSAALN
ncbi:MAG: DUF4405 domain-containing protein [Syntrophomonadaceae bacterium]